jgi:hypothetical protein
MPRKELGRIYFPGNPWPKGHAITKFAWTGRVERSSGIWFDLHLETEPYRASDPKASDEDDEDDDASDWESNVVWCNYNSCTLSSTQWNGYGFLAGSASEPLDWKSLNRRAFAFDQKPGNLMHPRPFNIYLTGHDSVCDHKLEIRRERGKRTFSFDWSGKIALTYGGETKFRHAFKASLSGVTFGGILFPINMSTQDAQLALVPFVANVQQFNMRKLKDHVAALPV